MKIKNLINYIKEIKISKIFKIVISNSQRVYSSFLYNFGFMTFLKRYVEADEMQSDTVIFGYGIRIMILLLTILFLKYYLFLELGFNWIIIGFGVLSIIAFISFLAKRFLGWEK